VSAGRFLQLSEKSKLYKEEIKPTINTHKNMFKNVSFYPEYSMVICKTVLTGLIGSLGTNLWLSPGKKKSWQLPSLTNML
jgi:hypothetical protein